MNNRTGDGAGTRGAVYSAEIPAMPGYYVYRLWAGDECIYVGRTGDNGPRPPQPRLNYHRRTREWWPEVTRIEVASLPDQPSMASEEYAQIDQLRPRHNTQRAHCVHDLSLPGAVKANGECGACAAARKKSPEARAAARLRDAAPEQKAKKREYDRARQPLHNAAKRLRRRTASPDQGSLW